MWYDTVGQGHPPALRCAADSFGADRLVLGTDFPYETGAVFERAVSYITTSGPERLRLGPPRLVVPVAALPGVGSSSGREKRC